MQSCEKRTALINLMNTLRRVLADQSLWLRSVKIIPLFYLHIHFAHTCIIGFYCFSSVSRVAVSIALCLVVSVSIIISLCMLVISVPTFLHVHVYCNTHLLFYFSLDTETDLHAECCKQWP